MNLAATPKGDHLSLVIKFTGGTAGIVFRKGGEAVGELGSTNFPPGSDEIEVIFMPRNDEFSPFCEYNTAEAVGHAIAKLAEAVFGTKVRLEGNKILVETSSREKLADFMQKLGTLCEAFKVAP